jgi:hypothetical protein
MFCPGETATVLPTGPRCFGATQPVPEKCDGLDWDCNGTPNDPTGMNLADKGMPCDALPAPCVQGTVVGCDFTAPPHPYYTNSHWVCSSDERGPQPEICDGLDNNCNSLVDEGFSLGTPCDGPDLDLCLEGVIACNGSGGTLCTDMTGDNIELCNGLDDDCNGIIDDPFAAVLGTSCSQGVGACLRTGTVICAPSMTATTCSVMPGMPTSETCNGIDDNCNGMTDETFPNLGMACTNGELGPCLRAGTYVCKADHSGTMCNAASIMGMSETCNNIDDDCNGTVDDGTAAASCGVKANACAAGVCKCGVGPICGGNADVCTGGTCDCGAVPACAGLSDTCGPGSVCKCGGMAGPCNPAISDHCQVGVCKCGSGTTCGVNADSCTTGICECGGAAACTGLSDTCSSGNCRCGGGPVCDSMKADHCAAGTCMCGTHPVCTGSQMCTAGNCM